jgi:hypothetical protein
LSHAVGREGLFWLGEAAAVFLVELVGIGGSVGLGTVSIPWPGAALGRVTGSIGHVRS